MNGLVQQIVAYADTDAGGVMYHNRYIELAERSRMQWILECAQSCSAIAKTYDILLVVHKLAATFHAPAYLEECVTASTKLLQIHQARSCWQTEIHRDNQLLVTVGVDIVAVSATKKKLVRFPDALVDFLSLRI